MAGIGFELRKLFNGHGLFNNVVAYAYSSLTTIGPMILCMFMVVGMQWLMTLSGVSFLEKELFLTTIVYCFIFSVLITGGLSMVLTRFIADMMYMKKYEHLLSSYYGSIAVCLPIGALTAWLFLRGMPVGPGYKIATYLLFSELIVIWLQTVHLSALKDYKRIVRSFLIGVVCATIGAWLLLAYTPYDNATSVLAAIAAGFFIVVLLSARHFEQFFPPRQSRIYWSFLSYLSKYPSLFFIGTFFYSGVYIHSFVYWTGSGHFRVADHYVISPFFDLPVFYAYLTVTPTLVTFVVSVETTFYEKFRAYYDKILSGGTLTDITLAKKEMQRTLIQEISFIMEVQLLFTVVSLALGIKLLPAIGFSMEQFYAFAILALGYFLFIIAFIVMLLLLYFDDRKGVLLISGLFVVLNAAFTYWTMHSGYHGLGLFLAALLTLGAALGRLMLYLRNIDYYTFCSQPIAAPRKSSLVKRWRVKASTTVAVLASAAALLSACSGNSGTSTPSEPADAGPDTVITEQTSGLTEDKKLYERDDDTSVIPMYVTILPEDSDASQPLTWYSLNRISDRMAEGELDVIAQEGSPGGSGPQSGMFGYGMTDANGKISLRGNSSRYASQRSYKIKLNDQAGLWHDQRTLNLNKHAFDPSRIRNKLSFDILETLPDITSLRSQFVQLYVKDLSEGGNPDKPFEDYGLYTHIEQPNKMFLKNHWLDPYGQLYKAVMFEFFRYPDEIKSQSDPSYNKEAFESRLEINGREEHDKLIAMLEDVNNMALPIDAVFEKHFDLDNYLTWLAANMLMDNMDTSSQNFLLYSPLNSNTWYFLPWDYDGGWELPRDSRSADSYESGISNYWNSKLHNRFFRSEEHVRMLKDKIDELYEIINNDTVGTMLEPLRGIAEPFVKRTPDISFMPIKVGELNREFERIAGVPLRSMERFKEDIEKPKPFYLGDVASGGGKQTFVWDPAFDLQGEDIVYDFMIAKDPAFAQIVQERMNLTGTTVELALSPGTYYWKVVARDESGHKQTAFDIYLDNEGERIFGVREAKVN
ncbi:exopolysaccharide Pel transporter PelG [Paenibacillus arenilitoris]|uniref:Exopolysaccharide Pel transporter PelG n=1 Tax=Paenibacillus arenilitoris TaxID=2772299 RepID=A0A927H3N9_9BACL|nr:exopolysaccharide Pel transporter PelG [Paenibacillus arenilitoris]MBD2867541.1 exopolysaccharide Pel transporter PelG [Paenibacillus arenilitoris]